MQRPHNFPYVEVKQQLRSVGARGVYLQGQRRPALLLQSKGHVHRRGRQRPDNQRLSAKRCSAQLPTGVRRGSPRGSSEVNLEGSGRLRWSTRQPPSRIAGILEVRNLHGRNEGRRAHTQAAVNLTVSCQARSTPSWAQRLGQEHLGPASWPGATRLRPSPPAQVLYEGEGPAGP